MKFLFRLFLLMGILANSVPIQAQKDSFVVLKKVDTSVKTSLEDLNLNRVTGNNTLQSVENGYDTISYYKIAHHPFLPLYNTPVYMFIDYRVASAKDHLFYVLLGLFFLLAFVKVIFPKYFKNLFAFFFQTRLRQKQTRDQFLQEGIATLIINLLFIISSGLFITLLIKEKNWSISSFWILGLYVTGVLTLIYAGKFIFLHFIGWVFGNTTVAASYLFQVFMVNRILGILLLPLSALLAFAKQEWLSIVIFIAAILALVLLLYRYLVSYGSLRNDLQLSAFHFFLYLCAVEILPMVLTYKLLVDHIG